MTSGGLQRAALAHASLVLALVLAGRAHSHEPPSVRVAALGRHLAAHPHDAEARVELATHLRRRGRAEKAVAEATRVLSERPGHCGARVERALARAALGQRSAAYADLTACIREGKETGAAHAVRARLGEEEGRLQEARADYSAAVKVAPTSDLVLSLARTSEAVGLPDEAARVLEEGLVRLGDATPLRLSWVALEQRRGRYAKAAALLGPLLDRPLSTSAALRLRRAELLAAAGDHPGAQADLLMALAELDARLHERPSASLQVTRAEVLLALGRRRDAAEAAEAALLLAPGLEGARNVLSKLGGPP